MAKSIKKLKDLLTKHFNAYIKVKHSKDGWCQCYTCDRYLRLGDEYLHCGHLFPKSANPALRFNEEHCRPQCQQCNYNDGERDKFYARLVSEIGLDAVKRLEDSRFGESKWSWDWYEEMIKTYRNKINELMPCL